MDCEQYQAQFTDFLEATLPEVQWRELEWHLRQCPQCAADIKHFRQTVGALRELEVVEPPRQLLRAISAQVASIAAADAAAQVVHVQPVRPVRRPFSWRVAGSLAGACLVLVAVAFTGMHGLRPGTAHSAVSAMTPGGTPGDASLTTPTPVTPPATATSPSTTTTPSATTATTPASSTPAAAHATSAAPATTVQPATTRNLQAQNNTVSKSADHVGAATRSGGGDFHTLMVPSPGETQNPMPFGPAPPARSHEVGVDIKVTPPSDRQVDTWGTVSISITPQGNVGHAKVRVVGGDALEVRSEQVYSGPLVGGEAKRVSARVRAHEPGTHALHVIVSSDTPVVDSDLAVNISGYHAVAHTGQTHRQFHSVPLTDAVAQVAADGGFSVQVSPVLAGRRITADFSGGLSARAALRLLAQMADATLTKTDSGYRLEAQ